MSAFDYTKNAIRHNVNAVSKLLGIDPASDPEIYVFADKLEQSIAVQSNIQLTLPQSLEKLSYNNPNKEKFLKKFEELKFKNIRELVPVAYLLAKISDEKKTFSALDGVFSQCYNQTNIEMNNLQLGSEAQETYYKSTGSSAASFSLPDHDSLRRSIESLEDNTISVLDMPAIKIPQRLCSPNLSCAHNIPKSNLQPDWMYERFTLWDDYLPVTNLNSEALSIQTLSYSVQEHAVVGDLLNCLQGNQGVYIKPLPLSGNYFNREFQVNQEMNPALLDSVNKLLPICADYSTIAHFVGEKSMFEYGLVNQALAEAMQSLIKDYFVLLCQLEYQYRIGQLGIARLGYFLQETATTFTQLARLCMDINVGRCTGGAVLSILYDSTRSVHGVKHVHELMLYLLRAASVPFFQMIQKWIYRGVISDRHNEFFIVTGSQPIFDQCQRGRLDSQVHTDRSMRESVDWAYFWETNYSIIGTNLPNFLEGSAHKILNTGKYLNIVQHCTHGNYEMPVYEELTFTEDESEYLNKLDQAYLFASSLLLKLMLEDKDLKDHFLSVKRFFLLDQGDFIVNFMESAVGELRQPSETCGSVNQRQPPIIPKKMVSSIPVKTRVVAKKRSFNQETSFIYPSSILIRQPLRMGVGGVSCSRLSSLFDMALRTSTSANDPFKDNLVVVLSKYDLITQILMVLRAGSEEKCVPLPIQDINLSALEAFSLDYSVSCPIGLVLNRQVMDRYQMLFRHLLYCKHVERLLCYCWLLNKVSRRFEGTASVWLTTAFLLSQRMLTFVQHFQYYMNVEIIEPTWQTFFKNLDKVSNLDGLLESHLRCLEVCMDDCLLVSPDLLSLVGKLCVVCVTFSNFIWHLVRTMTGLNLERERDQHKPLSAQFDSTKQDKNAKLFLHDPVLTVPTTSTNKTHNRRGGGLSNNHDSQEFSFSKAVTDNFDQTIYSEAFGQTVNNFDLRFNGLLVELLDKIKDYSKERNKLSSLVSRLDFNGFYTNYALARHPRREDLSKRRFSSQPKLSQTFLVPNAHHTLSGSTSMTYIPEPNVASTAKESDNEDYI